MCTGGSGDDKCRAWWQGDLCTREPQELALFQVCEGRVENVKIIFFVNPLLFASCTDTVKLLEA
jgi:hypothetical protein